MKQFKFKLEKILKYRKLLKDAQQGKLVRAEEARNQTLAELKELDLEREELYQAMVENAEQGFSLVAQQGQETFNRKIEFEKNKEKIRLAKRTKAVEIEKQKLVRLAKNEKVMEKFKDKAKDLARKDCLLQEMKQIDDLTNTRFCQQRD
jgi:flagellar export protein FliJ